MSDPGACRRNHAEPITYDDGLGVATWRRGDAAFTPHRVWTGSTYAHWPTLAQDAGGTLYLVWDTNPSQAGTAGGCDGAPTPAPQPGPDVLLEGLRRHVVRAAGDRSPASARALWPWAVAGDAGKLNVVWYETDKVVDLACQQAKLRIHSATLTGAASAAPSTSANGDAAGRPIADNNLCQNGTLCVATGEDRRLGDFFTNAVDERGCVLIASGDTMQPDPVTGGPRPISLPILLRQTAGPKLVGKGDCKP